ncbi:hypothetical protein QTP88_010393 [Uroleucon formosanum]
MDPKDLKGAMLAIDRGKGKRESARNFGIPYSTLKDRLKIKNTSSAKYGRLATFTVSQENELANHCIYLAKMFYGLSPIDLRKAAYEFAVGKDWLQAFIKRHPKLSIRKPEATSIARISGFNKAAVQLFFSNLNELYQKYSFQPDRIYNVDETGISTVPQVTKILGPKAIKQLGKVVSWERGRNITVVCAIRASGNYVPLMFIYPRERMSDLLKKDGPIGAVYECSKKGWINEELFIVWLKHFVKITCATPDNPILLLLDNHSSHCTLASFEYCRENGIVMLSFPPHTSHKLQPLDLTVFGSLKKSYSNQCGLFLRNNNHEKITPYDIAGLFKLAFVRIATVEKAQNGFKESGVVPFNPLIFTDEDFLPASIIAPDVEMTQVEAQPDSHTPTILDFVRNTSDQPENVNEQAVSTTKVTIQEISPLHIKQNKTPKRAGKKGTSKILTGTPEKSELQRKENNKLKKLIKTNTKIIKKEKSSEKSVVKKKLYLKDSSSSGDETIKDLCDDKSEGEVDEFENELCILCNEFGKTEMWFRCGVCKKWAHKECTGHDDYKTYICDFCK